MLVYLEMYMCIGVGHFYCFIATIVILKVKATLYLLRMLAPLLIQSVKSTHQTFALALSSSTMIFKRCDGCAYDDFFSVRVKQPTDDLRSMLYLSTISSIDLTSD
ncbi:hypothetical protein GQX74_009101 [Glossina fuscipes]|nr:hypothetical protein GQX74_009101 [Glossina fuscipes]